MLLLSKNTALVFGNTHITKWKASFDVVQKLDERDANQKCKDLKGEVQENKKHMFALLKMYFRQKKGLKKNGNG